MTIETPDGDIRVAATVYLTDGRVTHVNVTSIFPDGRRKTVVCKPEPGEDDNVVLRSL